MELKNDEDKEEGGVKHYSLGGENGEVDPFLGDVMIVDTKEATV